MTTMHPGSDVAKAIAKAEAKIARVDRMLHERGLFYGRTADGFGFQIGNHNRSKPIGAKRTQ